jgi:small subunit ribosomal protein S2
MEEEIFVLAARSFIFSVRAAIIKFNMEQQNNIDQKISIKLPETQELVAAGVHLGHKTSRWHPKMEQYIFNSRNNVHVFDLEKTLQKIEEALTFISQKISRGGVVILVGTKPTAKAKIKEAGQTLGMPYVSERWLGGTLTNFKTISKRIQHLKDLEEQQKTGQWDKFTKKEKLQLQRKMEKMQGQLEGIRNMIKLPEVMLAVDVKMDNLAIREAKKMKIPVVAICDTDTDPSLVDYIIPANDDASASLKILIETIVNNLKDVKPAIKEVSEKNEENMSK